MSQQINLYNPALRLQRDWLALTPLAIVVAVLLGLVAAAGAFARHQAAGLRAEVQRQEAEVKRQQALVTQLGAKVSDKAPDELLALRRQLLARQEVLAALNGLATVEGARFSDFLAGLARQSVSGLWLTGFAVRQGGSDIEISGRMSAASLLPDYIRRLNAEKSFQGRRFIALDLAQGTVSAAAGGTAAAAVEPPRFSEFKLVGIKAAPAGSTASANAKAVEALSGSGAASR